MYLPIVYYLLNLKANPSPISKTNCELPLIGEKPPESGLSPPPDLLFSGDLLLSSDDSETCELSLPPNGEPPCGGQSPVLFSADVRVKLAVEVAFTPDLSVLLLLSVF